MPDLAPYLVLSVCTQQIIFLYLFLPPANWQKGTPLGETIPTRYHLPLANQN